MADQKIIPLTRGLIVGETAPIYGQLELFLTDYKNIEIVIRRKPYTGLPDIEISMSCTSLQSFLSLLQEAKDKLDEIWLSRTATIELGERRELNHIERGKAKR